MMIQITMFYFLHNSYVVLRKYMQHSKAMFPRVFLFSKLVRQAVTEYNYPWRRD
jgi:hypothetical protein